MKILERARTPFQDVVVRGDGVRTEFQVSGAIHAWHHEHRYLAVAWGAMAAAALLTPYRPPRRILMLGLAGGTVFRILRFLLPDARLTAVEIDPWILDLARRHMRLDDLGIDIHLADAKHWLARNRRRFDVVIDDCYLAGTGDVFRPNAFNPDTQQHLQQALAPDGVLAVNLITGTGHRKLQSAYRAWYRTHCRSCMALTDPDASNEILVGGEALARPASLRAWGARFAHALDRRRWSSLRVRRI